MDFTVGNALDLLQQGGLAGFLLLALVGSYKGWWVWKRDYELLKEDRDREREDGEFWRSSTLNLLGLTDRTFKLHERILGERVE